MSERSPADGLESVATTSDTTTYWRSLEQLENSAEFQQIVEREFPEGAADTPTDDVSRRGFLNAIAASVALAGLTSCRKPKTTILPFNKRPEGSHPGTPQWYATTIGRGAYGIGVLVKSSDGRPTKIEGNPAHPSSRGGSDARLQAELLQIYDPGRSRAARRPHEHATGAHGDVAAHGDGHGTAVVDPDAVWVAFYEYWEQAAKTLVTTDKGAGLHVLIEPTTSPALLGMRDKLKDALPAAQFYAWTPLHSDEALHGSKAAFGSPVETHVDFAKASIVASFDADFLALDGNNLRSAHDWAKTRKAPQPGAPLSRLYVFETCYSTTGTVADHRFRMAAQDVTASLFQLAAELGVSDGTELAAALANHKQPSAAVAAVAKDLRAANGACAVVVGPRQPRAAHAVAHAINTALGAIGKAVTHTAMPESLREPAVDAIARLAANLAAPSTSPRVLVCLGTNPAFDAPRGAAGGRGLGELLRQRTAGLTVIHVGHHEDETAALADWHLPLAHALESWGDTRAHDGTISLRQPLIEPLFGGVSELEVLAFLAQQGDYALLQVSSNRDASFGHALLKEHWRAAAGAANFDSFWANALHEGVIADSAFAAESVRLQPAGVAALVAAQPKKVPGFEISLRPCPKMWDGRYANNSWMQELPDPLTKLTWDNAVLVGVRTAARLQVENGDRLAITAGGAEVVGPVWILPGHAEECATIYLGWGRELSAACTVARSGDGKTTGFSGYRLRTAAAEAQWTLAGATVVKTSGAHRLVCTQEHGTMAGRAIVRENTAAGYQQQPDWAPRMSSIDKAARLQNKAEVDLAKSLWTERYDRNADGTLKRDDAEVKRTPYQWGMVIDLNACTGCSACVIACVAENNIPMVGKTQVGNNREMFWIRADRYFASAADKPLEIADTDELRVANMPVPCMQCENAPCESVCPVAATMHSPDGLNDMVYNRCIGTRYCSNNCPYKVRRFNYFNYVKDIADTKQLAFNPDVTVRARGVMEKCTYCVQRINGGRIQAKMTGKKVGDGASDVRVATACEQACPTQAITFGNIIDTSSNVARLRSNSLNYGLLTELNTKPRTTYLGRVRNPNPDLLRG